MFEVFPRTDAEELARLILKLDSGEELRADERRLTSSYLRRYRDTLEELKGRKPRGRPPAAHLPDMALDYLVRKKLHGNWKKAKDNVARAWAKILNRDVSEETVEDAYTNFGANARWRLSTLTEWGRLCGWTEKQIFEAVSLDVRDHHLKAAKSKQKGSRRKSG